MFSPAEKQHVRCLTERQDGNTQDDVSDYSNDT